MAYVAVVKALFDYAAQDPETELSFSEDQILYVVEKEDDDWWKAKIKDESNEDAPVGLIPATYVEEIPPISTCRALYAYESTSPEELSMDEDQQLYVFSAEEDWLLVRVEGGAETLGFVPRNYCEAIDESTGVAVEDAAEGAAEVEAARAADAEAAQQRELQRQLKLKDKVETWSISEMDGRKKKKGTLGVGNGAVFFASESDKMTPVKQYSINELSAVSQPSSKNLELSFSNLAEPLLFHCGSSETAKAIIAKLETSKAAAGEALEMVEASRHVASDGEDDYETPPAEPKAVRWADPSPDPPAAAGNGSAEVGKVMYDFEAQGDDELTVNENDVVTVIDKENDEWWLVRNSAGKEGVVPAQYIEIGDGAQAAGGYDSDDERQRQEDEAAAGAAVEAERQREQSRKAEQRRAIERAAREKQAQEDHDRRLAEAIEAEEAEKRAMSAARRDEQTRQERESKAEKRREAARRMEPPKISKRPSAQNVAAAAANLPTRGHAAPARPPDNDRPKPNPARTRVWSDKSGQFKVEAEYLGVKDKKIRLHKLNGVIIEVPIEKMSEEDVSLVRRHESRKSRAMSIQDDDDIPLGRSPRRQTSGQSRSTETLARESPAPTPQQRPRKRVYDWFAFFLDAGVDMDDCTRYAARFDRDSLDETLIPELDASTLRSLGLKEGDILRVKRVVETKYAKKTPEQEAQIRADEDYAKQLQEHENSGSKGPPPQAPPGLFTGPSGKLANNTRRGRPEKKSSGPETVDDSAIAGAADALSRATLSPTPPPPVVVSPAPEVKKEPPANLITGFDDDAWTIKPSSSKPASPAPGTSASVNTSPSAQNGTDSLLAQIQALRPANTGMASQNTGSSFDNLSKMVGQPRPVQPTQTGSSSGFPSQYGLGVQGSNMPMGQIQSQQSGNSNGARGPVAPVPSNQGLLNPMQPNMTGMFVPTRGSPVGQQPQQQMQPQQTGFMAQQYTGFAPQQQPMMMQPTGYAQGFQQGYGQMQPNMTGYNPGFQQQNSSFNQIANMPQQQPQQPPQPAPDKFAPSNIFAAMKKSDFGKPEDQQPQNSGKYDALRPLATGYNGGPGMQPQQTGMQPQQTGYGNGMMPQMTGYNPQMGMGMGNGMGYMPQQGQGQAQNPYGYR